MAKQFDVLNPATEDVIAQVPDTGKDEWLAALGRAVEAQRAWAEFSPRGRAEVLRAVYEKITARTPTSSRAR